MDTLNNERGKKKIKFGAEVFHGETPEDLPLVQLSLFDSEIIASYSGPDSGLAFLTDGEEKNGNVTMVAGAECWNKKEQQAYGICISLYEQHPVNQKMSGDPIADAFSVCARKNNTVMVIADGVNWGEKSRLAARCSLYGSMNYINSQIFQRNNQPASTQEALTLLRESFDEAHRLILEKHGGLTTVCACLICPVSNSDQYAICCVNVGDSFGYIFSHNQGIREVTIGSHDVSSVRDIRDAGGALGPVDGINPELHNLTCSLSFCNSGDVVFLTTDGISDNFDPVVTKIALPIPANDPNLNNLESNGHNSSVAFSKPELSPRERHVYSMKEMERVVHEFELITEEQCSAQELCGALVQHVLMLTDSKRKILENPALYSRKRLTTTEKQQRDSEIVDKMSKAPGKLDHASIVAVEVGAFNKTSQEDDWENEVGMCHKNATTSPDISCPSTLPLPDNLNDQLTLSSTQSKKSGARKFFARFKNLPSPTLPSGHSPLFSLPTISPKKSSSKKYSRSRTESEPHTPTSPTIPESLFEDRHESKPRRKGRKARQYERSLSFE